MFPSFSFFNMTYSHRANMKRFSYLCVFTCILFYLYCFVLGEFMNVSVFSPTVGHIISLTPLEEMSRINTEGIVTFVEDIIPLPYMPIMEHPRCSVRLYCFVARIFILYCSVLAVISSVYCTNPQPTSAIWFRDEKFLESFSKRKMMFSSVSSHTSISYSTKSVICQANKEFTV